MIIPSYDDIAIMYGSNAPEFLQEFLFDLEDSWESARPEAASGSLFFLDIFGKLAFELFPNEKERPEGLSFSL